MADVKGLIGSRAGSFVFTVTVFACIYMERVQTRSFVFEWRRCDRDILDSWRGGAATKLTVD